MTTAAIREAGNPQLVILGAGLDARAWRIPESAATAVFEVDHPASRAGKRERLGERKAFLSTGRLLVADRH